MKVYIPTERNHELRNKEKDFVFLQMVLFRISVAKMYLKMSFLGMWDNEFT